MTEHYQALTRIHATRLVECVCTILSKVDEAKLAGAIKQTLALPSQILAEKSASEGPQFRDDICKALSMYAGCARAINDLPDSVLTNALSPLFTEVWPYLQQLLSTHPNDIEMIE